MPLVLRAFQHWEESAPARMRGVFAVAYWDGASGSLMLATDHLGRHPVFYTRGEGFVAFATSLRQLLAMPGVPQTIDDRSLAAFVADVTPEEGATIYAAVRRVPSACTLTIRSDGRIELHRYWQPDWGFRLHRRRDEDYVEEGRALLDQAVKRVLPRSGPVVCMLSGGLDSSAVTATAARLAPERTVHALTMAPAQGVLRYEPRTLMTDERVHAAAVAALHPNIAWECLSNPDLHPIDLDPERFFDTFRLPARHVMNLGWFAPSADRARILHARTILGGPLGNLTLSWEGLPGLVSMAKRGQWLRLVREVRALALVRGVSPLAILRSRVLRPLLPPGIGTRLDIWRGRPTASRFSAINPEFARATAIEDLRRAGGAGIARDAESTRRQWLTGVQRAPDGGSAGKELFGVTRRDPTADIDLLEFCFAVPDEQYIRNGVTRWLARRVLADRLPPQVVNETRRGLQCPEFLHRMTLRRDAIVEGVEALERSPLASRVLDVPRLKRLAGNWPTDPATTSFNEYGAVLNRGLHYGQFLRWIEGGNR